MMMYMILLMLLSFSYSSHEYCREKKYIIEHCKGYHFKTEYKPSDDYHSDVDRFNNFIRTNSTYICDDVMTPLPNSLINYQYISPNVNSTYFNASYFLSLIRNRQFSIIGDSVGMQIFHALNAELYPYQSYSESSDSNGTHVSYRNYSGTDTPIIWNPPDYNAAHRYYHEYNATLFFCRDNTIEPWNYIDTAQFCSDKALYRSDVVLIASGAWDKPPLQLLDHIQRKLGSMTYDEILTVGLELYETKMRRINDYIKRGLLNERKIRVVQHPPLVIWRNQLHSGPIDEYNYYYPNHTYSYSDGKFWDSHLKEAEWPYRYNTIMSGLASLFGDVILNAYKVSKDMLSFVNLQRKNTSQVKFQQIHADALHYCAGGLPRALLTPLSDLIEHHYTCRHHDIH